MFFFAVRTSALYFLSDLKEFMVGGVIRSSLSTQGFGTIRIISYRCKTLLIDMDGRDRAAEDADLLIAGRVRVCGFSVSEPVIIALVGNGDAKGVLSSSLPLSDLLRNSQHGRAKDYYVNHTDYP